MRATGSGKRRRDPLDDSAIINWESVRKDLFLVPNLITIGRILLVAPILFLFIKDDPGYLYLLTSIIVVAYISDYVDGYLARKLRQHSALGTMLDPVADKIWTAVMLVMLVLYREFPLWMTVLLVGRDMSIMVLSLFSLTRQKEVIPSDEIGKKYLVMIGLMMVMLTAGVEQAIYIGYAIIPIALLTVVRYAQKLRMIIRGVIPTQGALHKGQLRS